MDCLCLCLCLCEKLTFSFQTGSDLHTACYINDKGDKVKKFLANPNVKLIQMEWVQCKTRQIKKINLRSGWSSIQGCLAPSSPQRRPGCHQGDEKNSEETAKFLDNLWKWMCSLPDSTSPSCTQWGRTLTPKGLDAGCRLLFLVFHTSSSWLSPNIIVIWFLHSFLYKQHL